jgi:hypothetical protein
LVEIKVLMEQGANTYVLLWKELRRRMFRPLPSFTFGSFLIRGIVIFGGLAIWIECLKYVVADQPSSEGIRLALLTYYPAVGCAAGQQIAVYEETRNYLREFGNTSSFALMGFCAVSFVLQKKFPESVLVGGVILSIFAIGLAWIAVGLDKPFNEPDPEVAVGGKADTPLVGDTGDFDL